MQAEQLIAAAKRAPYGRGAETVYPTGSYFKGGAYGTDVVLLPAQEEMNNPNWTGCTDKKA